MASKVSANRVLGASKGVLAVWKANPTLKVGDETFAQYSANIEALETLDEKITDEERDLTTNRNTRDDNARTLNKVNTRFLSLVRGQFGPDSSEYELAGGTRSSERKAPVRRKKTGTA
jgi:hypothetical protein